MASTQIREVMEKLSRALTEQPEKARVKNALATASLVDGLKCTVTGPAGEMLQTDMPAGIGGGGSAPNPGWYMRAALASCNATCIAMRAARRNLNLSKLEVTVSSETDNRGLLGIDDQVSAGMQGLRVQVIISAPGASSEELTELVQWACGHSPVGCSDLSSARIDVQVQ